MASKKITKRNLDRLDRLILKIEALQHQFPNESQAHYEINTAKNALRRALMTLQDEKVQS